jgi:ORF6N domain
MAWREKEQNATLVRRVDVPKLRHPPIFSIRGRQVVLAGDLASLFGVSAKRLNEQLRRNERRFPEDFGFRISPEELLRLRPHFAASNPGRGGHRYPPFVLTEYGVVMVANVLNSDRAISMSVEVVRQFVRLRALAHSQDPIKKKLAQLERAVNARLDNHEDQIDELFDAVESLIEPEHGPGSRKRIGFAPEAG